MTEGPFATDADSLKTWWASLVEKEPPGGEVVGLWFGLFESADGTTLYVQGYPTSMPATKPRSGPRTSHRGRRKGGM